MDHGSACFDKLSMRTDFSAINNAPQPELVEGRTAVDAALS
jgi:hypothetical protein